MGELCVGVNIWKLSICSIFCKSKTPLKNEVHHLKIFMELWQAITTLNFEKSLGIELRIREVTTQENSESQTGFL